MHRFLVPFAVITILIFLSSPSVADSGCGQFDNCRSCVESNLTHDCVWCTFGLGHVIAIPEMPGRCMEDYRKCESGTPFANMNQLFELTLDVVNYMPVAETGGLSMCFDHEVAPMTSNSTNCNQCLQNGGDWCELDIHLPILGGFNGGICTSSAHGFIAAACNIHKSLLLGELSIDLTLTEQGGTCGRGRRLAELDKEVEKRGKAIPATFADMDATLSQFKRR